MKPYITLSGVLSSYKPTSWRVSQRLNGGWLGSLEFAQLINHRAWPVDTTVVVTLRDGRGGTKTTPPMVLRARGRKAGLGGLGTSFALVDLTSYKLSGGTESFDTFVNSDSGTIAAAIGTRFSVTVGTPADFPIWKEDIKLSNGIGPLGRIALVGGQQYYINEDGVLQFVSNSWTTEGEFLCDSEEEDGTPGDRIERLFISKNLGAGTLVGPWYYDFNEEGYPSTTLTTPITNAVPLDVSGIDGGFISWLGFWDADDKLIEIHPLSSDEEAPAGYSVPLDGVWPAARFTCVVKAPASGTVRARVQISGTPPNPPPEGIDPAFAQVFGTGRGAPQPFQEALIPSLAWAEDHWEDYRRELNRGKDVLKVAGPLDCSVGLGLAYTARFFDLSGRAEEASWALAEGQLQTTLSVECGT